MRKTLARKSLESMRQVFGARAVGLSIGRSGISFLGNCVYYSGGRLHNYVEGKASKVLSGCSVGRAGTGYSSGHSGLLL